MFYLNKFRQLLIFKKNGSVIVLEILIYELVI